MSLQLKQPVGKKKIDFFRRGALRRCPPRDWATTEVDSAQLGSSTHTCSLILIKFFGWVQMPLRSLDEGVFLTFIAHLESVVDCQINKNFVWIWVDGTYFNFCSKLAQSQLNTYMSFKKSRRTLGTSSEQLAKNRRRMTRPLLAFSPLLLVDPFTTSDNNLELVSNRMIW